MAWSLNSHSLFQLGFEVISDLEVQKLIMRHDSVSIVSVFGWELELVPDDDIPSVMTNLLEGRNSSPNSQHSV